MRLLVVSHTPHYRRNGQLVGWGATVRELDYLAELFDELVHVAPVYEGQAPSSAQAYSSDRVRVRTVAPAGGQRLDQKLTILTQYPAYGRVIRQELKDVDAVHVRCPANISLLALGMLMQAERPAYRWVKYAGNWQPDGADPWTYGLQRRWLAENRHRGVVTINGRWPDQPPHVHTFDNPSLTVAEIEESRRMTEPRQLTGPAEILFVGALTDGKGAGRALEVARHLRDAGVPFRLHLLGDGPDRPRYEGYVDRYQLENVIFHGWMPRDAMGQYYSQAHFVLLPSQSEGWPKVLSEGMAYGAVPIAGAVSSIAQTLAETGAGMALPYDDTQGMAEAIAAYMAEPDRRLAAAAAGMAAANRFTYGHYQSAVAALFREAWGVELPLTQVEALTSDTVEAAS